MVWAELYPGIKSAHLALAAASVALFGARWLGVLAGHAWPMRAAVRRGSVLVDTGLLGAGLMLWITLGLHPLRQPWLGVKLVLIVLYIVTGAFALRHARARSGKLVAGFVAWVCIAAVVAIAMAHDPWVPLRWLGA